MACVYKIKGQEQTFNTLEELAAALYNGEISDDVLPEEFRQKKTVDTSKIDQKIQELRNKQRDGLTPLKKLQEFIKDVVKSNTYLTNYFGEDLAQARLKRPEEKQIARYEELISKIDRKVAKNVATIVNRANDYYKNLGLTPEEVQELKDLNKTLNDWKTFQGAGIAETLETINALQENAKTPDIKIEMEDNDFAIAGTALEEAVGRSEVSGVRGIQASTQAVVTVANGNLIFSHINLETLVRFFEGGVLTEAPENQKEKGATFTISTPNGEIKGQITDTTALKIKKEDFDNLKSPNVVIKNFSGKSPYTIINERVNENEDFKPVESDFKILDKNGKETPIDENVLNSLEKGEELDLVYDVNDNYNHNVASKMGKKEQIANMTIYVYKGEVCLGILPAVKKDAYKDEDKLYALRESVYNASKKKERTRLNKRITVEHSFLGSPNVELTEAGEVRNRAFNQQDVENVVGVGYVLDGVFTSTIDADIKDFARQVSKSNPGKKIAFVIFKNNGKNIAFPISLNKVSMPIQIDLSLANAQVNLINALNEAGLPASSYNIDFTEADWAQSEEAQRALNDLSENEIVVDMDLFISKNYDKKNLINDATIGLNISDKPISSSKVLFSPVEGVFSDVVSFKEQLYTIDEEKLQLVEDLNKEAEELYKNFKTNEEFRDIYDVHFTDVLDEQPIDEAKSYLDKIKNINILGQAFSKPIRGKLKEALGEDNITELKTMLKQYETLTKKATILKDKLKQEAQEAKNKKCIPLV